MLNNFIYAKTKDLFIEQLEANQILDEAIVFIEDTKEIWNHGTYFAGISDSGLDQETIDQINAEIENVRNSIPTTTSQLTNDSGFLTEHQDISGKQDVLVTGVNIKTINGQSLLGEGTIDIPAEENVQSDWDTSSTSEDSYIKNRPMYANWTNIPDGHLTFSGEWEQLPGTYAGERVAFKYIFGSSEKYCTVGPNNEEYMLNPGPSVWVKMDSSVLFIKCSYAHDCKISYSTKLIPLNDIYIPTTIARATSLDLKQDVINDLDDIRQKANSALQDVPDEYITETELNNAINSVAFTEDYGSEVVMPVSNIVSMSQEEYDALTEKNPNTIYLIV